MRRLTLLAVAGVLGLYACSDQNTESPTEPSVAPPSESFGSTCDHGRYPFTTVAPLTQDSDIFKSKPAKTEALLRLGAVALLWDTCHDLEARQAALRLLAWIDQNQAKNADQAKVDALKAAILAGFGGTGTPALDYASDVYLPGTTKIITTPSGRATIMLTDGAFNEPTLITVRRLPDNSLTEVPDGFVQDAPTWDYDATNSSTDNTLATHTLATPGTVTIAFCFKNDATGDIYPEPGARIGHNPVGGGFELVDDVTPVPPDLVDELSACTPPVIGGANDLRGLSRYLAEIAQKVLLPEALHAAAATVGTRGPIAGTPISLSPFGIVVPSSTLSFTDGGDPSEQTMAASGLVVWGCADEVCNYPELILTNSDNEVMAGETISVELLPADGSSTGQFTVANPELEEPGSITLVETDETGEALFDQLEITPPFPGNYMLKFSGGGASITSGVFTVTDAVIP
jgi:hypothetical protein